MDFKNAIGFGVAGNFAGHLEQAGEAADFLSVETKEAIQPKAIFPFFPNKPDSYPFIRLVQINLPFLPEMPTIYKLNLKLL